MFRSTTALLLAVSFFNCHGAEESSAKAAGAKVDVGQSASVATDLDCDGKPDLVRVFVEKSRIEVRVAFANPGQPQARFSFAVSSGIQDAVCALPVFVAAEPLDYDLSEIFGEPVPGFIRSNTCKGLVIADFRCDSLHFFWNHKNRRLEWWRL